MRSIKSACTAAALLLFSGAFAHAVTVSGTVTDKTTNKPSPGDKVELVDVQQGMAVVATTTTDAKGHYKLEKTGAGPELVRVTHQGGQYFIAAPEGGEPGDIPVYDVAANVEGLRIEADVIEVETQNGQLQVTERYFVHNTAQPQHTQYNPNKGFEVVIPAGAILEGASAKRPTGMPTVVTLKPGNGNGHYQFDFPIQPDEGDKDTLFQLGYHVPYSGSFTFHPQIPLAADNVAVLLPKSISFKSESGATYQSVPQDPSIQTMLAKNVGPGTALDFTVSGEGSMPREQQGAQGQAAQGQAAPNGPGGGIGEPINTPDPLSKYKWWMLGGIFLLLSAVAAFLLRKPAAATAGGPPMPAPDITRPVPRVPRAQAATAAHPAAAQPYAAAPSPASYGDHNATLLHVLKEEMFAIESEKLSGVLSPADYAEQKSALEIVLKRALQKKS
ncbi:carboxypeptidase regulatory-like domain-containing protein [Acidobacteria bacterium AB60]|nr:carboxypeptidase regulatory-like domain-containing protein [Acidobacteria bacterium AB60]